jgi:hypothetical protein
MRLNLLSSVSSVVERFLRNSNQLSPFNFERGLFV